MTEEVATELSSLGVRFLDRSLRDLDEIEHHRGAADSVATTPDRNEMRRLVHRMAGTAGSFGFSEIGREAQLIEAFLREPGGGRSTAKLVDLAKLRRLVFAARRDA